MKTLFIFKPSDDWSYCGGGLVIIADSFAECQKMFTEELYKTEEEIPKTDFLHNAWVLVETFKAPEQDSRIVLEDYNWG